jgi:mannose-6-phosphate isomerase-like protein (cupin superfamily)
MIKQNKNKFVKGNIASFNATSGYFIGRFMGEKGFPDLETEEVEIAWKKLPTTFNEPNTHYHKGGVEINIVISGKYRVEVNGEEVELAKGDFLVVYPEAKLKNLMADPNTELIVVKTPSIQNDKFES